MQRMHARVFACLLADDEDALTAAELAARLHVSPAAISGAVRSLTAGGLVLRERRPGERRDRYRLGEDLWSELYGGRVELLRRWDPVFAQAAEALGSTTRGGRRMAESRAFFAFLLREFPALMERWRAERARLGV